MWRYVCKALDLLYYNIKRPIDIERINWNTIKQSKVSCFSWRTSKINFNWNFSLDIWKVLFDLVSKFSKTPHLPFLKSERSSWKSIKKYQILITIHMCISTLIFNIYIKIYYHFMYFRLQSLTTCGFAVSILCRQQHHGFLDLTFVRIDAHKAVEIKN